ncbi:hypothetical protein [Methanoculleus sp.]|uniref:hypothetical protein n=1 Tax=Methanoculleus sp. TaxID=90427 RepID=UPI001BD3C10D|nr:hypothetical protein [Methanoculleus sp.]
MDAIAQPAPSNPDQEDGPANDTSKSSGRAGFRKQLAKGQRLVPTTRAQALALLTHIDDVEDLTDDQRAVIRDLYFLNDDRPVAERFQRGRC